MENNYSLSDLATVARNGDFGGNGFMWLILIFLLVNNGFGGYGRGDYGQYATAASQQEILFGQRFMDIDNKIDRLGNGLSDLGFSLNNSIKDGNSAVAGTVVSEGRAIQDKLCGIANLVREDGEKTRGLIQQNKIETLQAQVNELKTQNMFCGIPRINPYGYGVYAYANQGCGCGNNF